MLAAAGTGAERFRFLCDNHFFVITRVDGWFENLYFCLANCARRNLRMSSSVFPENIEPQLLTNKLFFMIYLIFEKHFYLILMLRMNSFFITL
jgi:hypothetical protein